MNHWRTWPKIYTDTCYTWEQWLKCKIRGGEGYIQVWAPDNGHVPFPSIITIWGGGTLSTINWRWETAFPCVPLHFNHCLRDKPIRFSRSSGQRSWSCRDARGNFVNSADTKTLTAIKPKSIKVPYTDHTWEVKWLGFQGHVPKVQVMCVQVCECYNGRSIHFDDVSSRLTCWPVLSGHVQKNI